MPEHDAIVSAAWLVSINGDLVGVMGTALHQLVEDVMATLGRHGVPPGSLHLEVTVREARAGWSATAAWKARTTRRTAAHA